MNTGLWNVDVSEQDLSLLEVLHKNKKQYQQRTKNCNQQLAEITRLEKLLAQNPETAEILRLLRKHV